MKRISGSTVAPEVLSRQDAEGAEGTPTGTSSDPMGNENQPLLHGTGLLESPEITTGRLLAIMGSIWLCTFFAAMDLTVFATLSGPISSEFESGTAFSWIASAYPIANAACQPLSGKITDIYGRRSGLIFATTFFGIGTMVCGFAQSTSVMIVGRVIAGMGGGCLNTISSFVGSDLIPLRRRGLWQGIANIVFGTGMSLGGVYGGLIQTYAGWRYAFFIQVPFIALGGACSSIMVNLSPKEQDRSKIKRVDFLGAIILVCSLIFLLLALNSGGNTVPWNHPLIYISLPLSIFGFMLFVYVEEHVIEPVIPIRLLLNRTVAAACAAYASATISVYMLIYYVPIYFQIVHGASTTKAGSLLIPQSIGMALGSLSAGYMMRATGVYWRWNMLAQLIFVSSAGLVLAFFDDCRRGPLPYAILLVNGIAYGAMLTTTFIALIGAVEHKYQAVITSASYAFRSAGTSVGIAIGGAIFQNMLSKQLIDQFGTEPGAMDQIDRIRSSLGEIRRLPPGWYDGVIASYVSASRGVWVAALGFAILTASASLFMREHVLSDKIRR